VCFLISGPGLLNAATAIAQARADSVPMLVISGVAAVADLGMASGTLHELPDQRASAASFCLWSHTLLEPDNLATVIHRAFAGFQTGRPGPVHLEIPLDLMDAPVSGKSSPAPRIGPPAPHPDLVAQAASRLAQAAAPLIVVGGGVVGASEQLVRLAEHLDAPVLNTVNGKGACPPDHPLAVGGSPSLPCLRKAISAADRVLAIGTELAETDYDLMMIGPLLPHPGLIRIDIDPHRLLIPHPPDIGIFSDAALGIDALHQRLASGPRRTNGGHDRARALRAAIRAEPHYHPDMQAFFDQLRSSVPEAVIVGDSTRPTYYAAWQLESRTPRSYWHSVSGFGTLGYALPAAFGAALATDRPVLALIGDGGIQFTLPELSTGAEAGLPVPIIIWHNDGYREIESSMRARNIPADATRIRAPDFEAVARAHRVHYRAPRSTAELGPVVAEAIKADRPTLIEVREQDFLESPAGDWYS
jgi:acetolactate synthase-1/2/3 large subunit